MCWNLSLRGLFAVPFLLAACVPASSTPPIDPGRTPRIPPQTTTWPETPPTDGRPLRAGVSCGADVLSRFPELSVRDVIVFRAGDVVHTVALRRRTWIPLSLNTWLGRVGLDLVDRDSTFVVFERLAEDPKRFTDYFIRDQDSEAAELGDAELLRLQVRRSITRACAQTYVPADQVAWSLPDYPDLSAPDAAPPAPLTSIAGDDPGGLP